MRTPTDECHDGVPHLLSQWDVTRQLSTRRTVDVTDEEGRQLVVSRPICRYRVLLPVASRRSAAR